MTTSFDAPLQVSEIILRTSRFDELKAWYQWLFGDMKPSVETGTERKLKSAPHVERLCFLRIHSSFPYTQVLGIFEVPEAKKPDVINLGLDHVQFREATMENLFKRYEHLKSRGIVPTHCFNHGPSTSFYYQDPDENVVELSAVNFPKEPEYLAFFQTEEFRRNVEGEAVEPEGYIAMRRAWMSKTGSA